MKVINLSNKEITYQPALESHKYILKQCEEIEKLYNCEVLMKHDNAMEYDINFLNKNTNEILLRYSRNYPGKTKNYLKGLIDSYKLLKTK